MSSFVKEYSIGSRKKLNKEEKHAAEDLRQKARDLDSKAVTGVFKNIEVEGGDVTFSHKLYKEDPHRTYHLEDGETYTIPLGVAKHLNNMTKVKRHSYLVGPDGKKLQGIGGYRQRYQFTSTEFM